MTFFFFNDTATTEIYPFSLHDALPISAPTGSTRPHPATPRAPVPAGLRRPSASRPLLPAPHVTDDGGLTNRHSIEPAEDRKSTRLNSSHANISYAVFCLKKKKQKKESLRKTRSYIRTYPEGKTSHKRQYASIQIRCQILGSLSQQHSSRQ